jgi:signal transduction histidine kinase
VIRSDSLPIVWADAGQMAAMFEILIANSLRFRDPDAPPRIFVSSVRTEELGGFAITDNGIGIDPEYRESALLPFMRLNGAKYAGAGLGLATAKLIAGMHGGRLMIDSHSEPLSDRKNSRGTCVRFTVRLGRIRRFRDPPGIEEE